MTTLTKSLPLSFPLRLRLPAWPQRDLLLDFMRKINVSTAGAISRLHEHRADFGVDLLATHPN